MKNDITLHQDFFTHYAQSFCEKTQDASMLHLKIQHTQRVLQYTQTLIQYEPVLQEHARACSLAALYHDIGRFEQFYLYNTFRDTASVNHALHGAKVLKKEGILQGEKPHVRKQVMAAVAMHNRFTLPQGLDMGLKRITCAIRDADKLDILRVMAEQFTPCAPGEKKHDAVTFYAKDEPLRWSPAMLEDIMQNRLASYANIVYINDFKLLLGSWVHDMKFATSKKLMLKEGYLHSIFESLPKDPVMDAAKEHIFSLLVAAQIKPCAPL